MDDAHGGAAHPVFLKSRRAVGADDNHRGLFAYGLFGDAGGHLAAQDGARDGSMPKVRLVLLAQCVQLFLGQVGRHFHLFAAQQLLLLLHPKQADARMELVGNINGNLKSYIRTFRKVGSDNNRLHGI